MASKLMVITPHEAENQTEHFLRQAYELLEQTLKPPFSLAIPNSEEYLQLNRAIVYGVLCEPHLAKTHIKHLHAIVTDGYQLFVGMLIKVVDELFVKLFDSAKIQLIWVSKEMIDVSAVGFHDMLVCLLRQIIGGDFSDGNLWLCFEVLNVFSTKWDCLLEAEPMILTSALYTYLRLLADHCRLIPNPKLESLKRLEIEFCVRMLKEKFHLCLKIGRDLVRLLQDLVHVPEIRAIWKDLIFNPGEFKAPEFSDISQLYCTRTSSRYFLLRITPEMEAQLRFLLTHVKLGSQKRHQTWFTKKFLCGPDRETVISDIVRFVCCGHHPPNEIIRSEVIPRWAVVGWLLKSCTKNYFEANVKLALFYDWLFFDDKVDNVMNIEPAFLLMVNSITVYVDMTHTLLEFLFLLVDNYDMERNDLIVKGVSLSFKTIVQRGVIHSLDVLFSCAALSPFLKERLKSFFSDQKLEVDKGFNSSGLTHQSATPLGSQSSFDLGTPTPSPERQPLYSKKGGSVGKLSDASVLTSDRSATYLQIDTMENLVQKFEEAFKTSNKICLKTFEGLLSFVVDLDNQRPGSVSTHLEVLSSNITKLLELKGYKLFPPLEFAQDDPDYDDEIGSPTALIIRFFIFSQHGRMQEMLLFWARNGFPVGPRLLSYASRLAYEEHMANCSVYEMIADKSVRGSNSKLNLFSFHVDGFHTFLDAKREHCHETTTYCSEMDKIPISKLVNSAIAAYRCFLSNKISICSKEVDTSLSKLLYSDIISCSRWERKNLKNLFCSVFCHLSDLSVGEEDLIKLVVDQLDHNHLLEIQFEISLKKFSIFGMNSETISNIIRSSLNWGRLQQHKLWGLIRSEFAVLKVQVEKIIMNFFCSGVELDENTSAIAVGGLLTLCSCCAPTPELVGTIMSLPNIAFQNFAAAVLATWTTSNASMLFDSLVVFSEKLGSNTEMIANKDGIMINHSALLWLLDYFSAHGLSDVDVLSNFSRNVSCKDTRR
ncbi:Integrator complex subunit [Parasponia andersonii]|uniref:Integrator complex subunit n=1 Tax=Parasponia andersonii TaxID=3476 RepID=A0A2P5CQQ1_PARAD|nr:Integrator complex subunit [Parasponia andersonii]